MAFKARRITPLGGSRELGSHKGYGLAMMVEILCSTLTGSACACASAIPTRARNNTVTMATIAAPGVTVVRGGLMGPLRMEATDGWGIH